MITRYLTQSYCCQYAHLIVKASDAELEYGYEFRGKDGRYHIHVQENKATPSIIADATQALSALISFEGDLDAARWGEVAEWITESIETTLERYDAWADAESKDIHRMHDEMRNQCLN